MTVTFVTAFLHLFEDRSSIRSSDIYINHFKTLASTGIPIYLFLSNMFRDDYERICGDMPNVQIEFIELYEFEAYTALENIDVPLPSNRCHKKDTRNYLITMNTKLECLHRAMVTNTSHYAWIDFGIKHVLSDSALPQIKRISNTDFGLTLTMPGCWDKCSVFFDRIHWRFCGGFFLGDKESIERFYQVSKDLWEDTCMTYGLTWEVNYWAYLEERGLIHPVWYPGDHNDTIIHLPY